MSQFIEMFGTVQANGTLTEKMTVEEISEQLFAGGDKPKDASDVMTDEYRYPIIANGIGESGIIGYSKSYRVDKDSLTVSARGTIGYCSIRKPYFTPVVRLITIIPKKCIHLLYLKYYFEYVGFEYTGAIQGQLTIPLLKEKKVLVPPMELQQQFVSIADQADKSGFVGVKSQFIEMTGDPRTNPKSWQVKTLSELATYSIGLTYKPENISEEGTIVLRSGNIQNSKIDLADVVRVNCPIKESIYVQKNDILMCSRNGSAALVGKVAQIKDISEPMTYGAFMTVIRSEYSDFLYLYFQSNDFREQVSTGKSSTMNQITQNMLDKISLPLPDGETRNKLSIILHQADKSGYYN